MDLRSADGKPAAPFFLYLAYDTPHAKLQLPPGEFPSGGGAKGGVRWLGQPGWMITTANGTPDRYIHPDYVSATWDHDRNPATPEQVWPDVYKRYATDVRRIDDGVGDLLQLLKDLRIDDRTLVVFTTDNGPSRESYLPQAYEPTFFYSFGPFDGIKRDCWEGGIRVGALVRWPGGARKNRVSDLPCQFQDWMPTFAELAGVAAPARGDGTSLVPTITGHGRQKPTRVYVEYANNEKTPLYPGNSNMPFLVLPGSVWDYSLSRMQIQTTAVEHDVCFEALAVAIAAGLFDQALDLAVYALQGGIG